MTTIRSELILALLPKFHDFMESDSGKLWKQERQKKDAFFQSCFSNQEMSHIDEGTLREMIYSLWAWRGWTNKDYLLERMLSSGLSQIKESFEILLYSNKPLRERFDHIKENVNMMGAASISEILAHHDHEKYAIWTRRSRAGLTALGVSEPSIPRSAQISGRQYEEFCRLVQNVREQVVKISSEFTDLFTLDYFLYFISLERPSGEIEQPVPRRRSESETEDFDHGEIIDQVLELGDGLGFEVEKEFTVARGCRIDALWRSRIANLGTITYAFEVHRHGHRDTAILNLERVKRDSTIQKVILVSSKQELDLFKEEIATLDENFRNSVGYLEVNDLQSALDHLESVKDILKSVGLLNVERLLDRA